MPSARPKIIARLVAATFLLGAPAQAEWYAGVGLHGLHSDQEHDGDIETELSFLGPRIYGGWRFSDQFAVEVEAGWAEFRGKLFSDTLNADLEMWNVAVTGIVYAPVDLPMRPFLYVGAGRSLWNYDIVTSTRPQAIPTRQTILTLTPGWGRSRISARTCGFGSAIGCGAPRCTRSKESGPCIPKTTPTGVGELSLRRIGRSDRNLGCFHGESSTLFACGWRIVNSR